MYFLIGSLMMYGSITSMAQSYVSGLKNFEIRCDAAQDHANHHHVNIEEVAAFQEKLIPK